MKTRSLILLASAITLAAGAALVGRALMRPPPPVTIVKEVAAPAKPQQQRQVLVAARPLTPGEFLDGGSLAWRALPEDSLRVEHYTASVDDDRRKIEQEVVGATPRRNLAEGDALTRETLVRNGEHGFIATVLKANMRAVSIPINAVSSNTGLVNAGDRVDVILYLERKEMEMQSQDLPNGAYTLLAAQTIVQDARVLGLNGNPSGIGPTLPAETDENPSGGRSPIRTLYESITLEVTPADAERLAMAREIGALQVALRGGRQADTAAAQAAHADVAPAVTRLGNATDIFKLPTPQAVKTFRGEQQGQQTFAPMAR